MIEPTDVAADQRLAAGPALPRSLTVRQRRQIALITVGAIAVFAFLRWLPTGTYLSHMDFRVDAKNSIDFCDPLNPQFIPVVAVASPVSMTLNAPPANAGREVAAAVVLKTASGKPIAPADLLVVHTERLHLLIADPSLTDYQHVHPTPGRAAGEWDFRFTPRFGGEYRIFADFTPAATNRGLYANTALQVAGPAAAVDGPGDSRPVAEWAQANTSGAHAVVARDGYRFDLHPAALPVKARTPVDLTFTIARMDGGPVPMEPVMGAFAHLVAFDEARSGFAHLHPTQIDLAQRPDPVHPTLDFKITIPKAGRYVVWAQLNLAGQPTFVPFWFDVAP